MIHKLTRDEPVRESKMKKRNGFDTAVKIRYGYLFTLPTRTIFKGSSQEADDTFDLPFDDMTPDIPESDIVDAQWNLLDPSSAADMLMNAEVLLPQGEVVRLAKVIIRNVDLDSKVLRDYNDIPMLNTILCDVQFPDGAIRPYSANLIVENILAQVDADGYHNQLLEVILDHSKYKQEVEKKYQCIVTKRGRPFMQQTTSGCKFRVKWKYGTVTWIYLKDNKESNHIEVDEYVTDRSIQDEPSF